MFNNTNSVSKEQEIVPKEEDVLKEEIIDDNNLSSETTQDLKAKRSQSKSSKNRGNPTPCPVCGVIICNSYNLSCHLRRHNNDKPYKCDQCPAAFILKTELQRHSVTHSKDRPFKCSICSKGYKNVEVLRVHVDTHGLNEYKCRHCGATFKDYRSRGSHERNFHNKNKLKCTYCYKTFSENKFREKHEILVHKRTDSKNEMDQQSRKRRKPRKPYIQRKRESLIFDSNFKYYPCKVCTERFKYRRDQLAHYQANHKEEFDKVFKICNICGKILTDKHYSGHMQAHEGKLPFACSHCQYKSARKEDLKAHTLVHTKEYLFKCASCQKPFRTKAHAQLCEKRHTGKKDVKCRTCDKTFFSVRELRSHETTRHKNRKCLCGYETNDKYMYCQHRKLHHKTIRQSVKKKSFMCDKCGSLFSTNSALRFHLRSHFHDHIHNSEIKKFQICSYCDYQGFSSSDILNHCIESHPTKVNKCEICSYTTLKINHFLSHIRHHVNKSAEELYVCTRINKKLEKECNTFILECFICGFSSAGKDHMEKHFEKHKRMFEEFPWFCSEEGFNLNFTIKGRKQKYTKKNQIFKKKLKKKLRIKSASEPRDVIEVQCNEHELLADSDRIDDCLELSVREVSDLLVQNDDEFYQSETSAKPEPSPCEKSTMKDDYDIGDSTWTNSKTLPDINLESSNSSISTTTTIAITAITTTATTSTAITATIAATTTTTTTTTTTAAPAERYDNSKKLTIKIRKFKQIGEACATKIDSLNSADYHLSNPSEEQISGTNINSLKNNLLKINGKLFLPLEDLCSVSNLNKETLLKLLGDVGYEKKNDIQDCTK